MRNVSNEFKSLMEESGKFYPFAQVTLANGQTFNLSKSDFSITGSSIIDGASSSSLALGVAVAKQIELSIFNDEDQFIDYDFYGATILLYLRFDLSSTTESIKIGTFTVTTPETLGTVITINAIDNMYKLDQGYSTNLTFPATLGAMVRDSCSTCDVVLGSSTFTNDSFTVQEAPTDITHRSLIAYAAQIAGGNARFDANNALQITTYNLSGFSNSSNVHTLSHFKNLTLETDDVVITGIQATVDEVTYLSGVEGYILSIDNPLITGNEQSAVDLIGDLMIGLKFRPFTGDHIAYPLAEFGDLAYVYDRKGKSYQTVLTDVDFTFYGYTTLKCSADSPIRNTSEYYSEATKAIVAARQMVAQEKTDREVAIESLNAILDSASGLFPTSVTQEDGSTILYLHDKRTLEESQVVLKLTSEAFGISNDGGATYAYGFTFTGDAILKLIYAVGINADYITTGLLQSEDGSVSWNLDTGEFVTVNGDLSVVMDKSGLVSRNAYSLAALSGGILRFWRNDAYDESQNGVGANLFHVYGDLAGGGIDNGSAGEFLWLGGVYTNTGRPYSSDIPQDVVITGTQYLASATYAYRVYWNSSNNNTYIGAGSLSSVPGTWVSGSLYAYGSFACGGTKYRVVDTEDFGKIGMNSLETMGAHFADVGSGSIQEDEKCYIYFDPVFTQTIDANQEYQVFITKTSNKEFGYVEKQSDHFIVHGEDGLTFDWQMIAKQKGYQNDYGEQVDIDTDTTPDYDESIFKEDEKTILRSDEYLQGYYEEIGDYD